MISTQMFCPTIKTPIIAAAVMLLAFSCGLPASNADVPVGGAYLVGWNADAPDGISVAIFEDLSAGDQLYFTDSGFYAAGDMRGVEKVMSWTAASDMSAGSVINIINTSTSPNANADEGTAIGNLSLSGGGDQVFIGNAPFPTTNHAIYDHSELVFGLDYNGVAGWDAESVSTSTSALPPALTLHNIAFTHQDNGVYIGPRSGLTIAQFQTAIRDESNWTFSNAVGGVALDSTDFQIVPEPTSMGLLGLLAAAMAIRKRQR